jgi:endonuclease/exonuclease/phosphatase family metal-dependent hydrolase
MRAAFAAPFFIADLEGQRPTRVPSQGHPGRTIDHVIVYGGTVEDARALDEKRRSDHAPVTASVRFD